jgi:Uma2 family endonuclease
MSQNPDRQPLDACASRDARPATRDDLLRQSEDRAFELVGGVLVEREVARLEHGRAQLKLGMGVGPFDRRGGDDDGPGGWFIVIEAEVQYDDATIYRHDLAGWRRDRLPGRPSGRATTVRPDWVCEIVSPTNWSHDTVTKFRTLQACNVPHYWVIDLERPLLTVYRHAGGGYLVAALALPGQHTRLEPFEALELDVSTLFGMEPGEGS